MSYNIISFYEKRDDHVITEYLVEHVKEMIDLINENSKTIRYGNQLLDKIRDENRLQHNIDYYDIIYTAIVFHDIGKSMYQPDPGYLKYVETISFSGHEIISGIVLDEILKIMVEKTLDTSYVSLLNPALFAIIFHHHALEIPRRLARASSLIYVIEKRSRGNIKEYIIKKIEETIDDLKEVAGENDLVKKLFKKLGENSVKEKIAVIVEKDLKPRYTMLKNNLFKILASRNESGTLKKLMYLTLVTLVSLDYEAARKTREDKLTRFGRMCILWRKYYIENLF